MDFRHFNLRRAEQERRKAEAAATEEVRQGHLEIARIFEARAAGLAERRPEPAAADRG